MRRRSDASVSPDDAEEAAKKLNQKEFFGKVVKKTKKMKIAKNYLSQTKLKY